MSKLTKENEYDEHGREASHTIEHELQIAPDQFFVVVELHENWWEDEANSDSELKRVNKRKFSSKSLADFRK